jgi:rhodanese-related sulfurtransferase
MNGPTVPELDPLEASQRMEAGAVLLDVREPDEWHAGHGPDAIWIPMGEIEGRHGELPANTEIIVVCRSGARSARVTAALTGAGYDAKNLSGGMQAWEGSGLPVVTDDGAAGSVA